jgi:hypothetical protein
VSVKENKYTEEQDEEEEKGLKRENVIESFLGNAQNLFIDL